MRLAGSCEELAAASRTKASGCALHPTDLLTTATPGSKMSCGVHGNRGSVFLSRVGGRVQVYFETAEEVPELSACMS
jgi:hypothetical protein